jgi:polyferredoxin
LRVPVSVPPKLDKWLRYLKYVLLALIIIASTVAIYPPLHDICPARAIFGFQLNTPLLGIVVLIFILSSMLIKRFTCKYICPLGAALVIFNKISLIHITFDQQNCINCGQCEVNCSMDIEAIPENNRSLECIYCLECLETCTNPDTVALKLI